MSMMTDQQDDGIADAVFAVADKARSGSEPARFLAIGFLEGLAAGMSFYSGADRIVVADLIREQAVELREML
jgi:hypothetical protein